MKKLIIPAVAALGLMTSTIVMANPYAQSQSHAYQPDRQVHGGPMKYGQKGKQVRQIMQQYRGKIRQLRQQAKVLKMQINGKMVTQGTSWNDISAMTTQLSNLKSQIMMLKTQARFEIYQKTGILLPDRKHYGKRFVQQ